MIRQRGLDTTPGGGGGWYIVRMANGSIGLQRINPGEQFRGKVVRSIYVGPRSLGIQGLLNNDSSSLSFAAGNIGANTYQRTALADQIDRGAGQDNNLQFLTIGRKPLPRSRPNIQSNVSTQGRSEAVSAGIPVPSFSGVTDFLDFITWIFHPLNWLRMVEFLTGIFFVYLGLRSSFGLRGRPPRGPVSMVTRRITRNPVRQGRRAARRQARFDRGYNSERERQTT